MCHTKSNCKNFPPNGQNAPQQNIVTCSVCNGENHVDTMRRQGDGYICQFCQMDESQPIPCKTTDLAALDDEQLCQQFIDRHADGDPTARNYLAELINRNEMRKASAAIDELEKRLGRD